MNKTFNQFYFAFILQYWHKKIVQYPQKEVSEMERQTTYNIQNIQKKGFNKVNKGKEEQFYLFKKRTKGAL